MGYIYDAMERAKNKVMEHFNYKECDYQPIIDIIHARWGSQMSSPLYLAACILNPTVFFASADRIVAAAFHMVGFLDALERMILDKDEQDKISRELDFYLKGAGIWSREIVVRHRSMKLPVDWWSMYGVGPNRRDLAL